MTICVDSVITPIIDLVNIIKNVYLFSRFFFFQKMLFGVERKIDNSEKTESIFWL